MNAPTVKARALSARALRACLPSIVLAGLLAGCAGNGYRDWEAEPADVIFADASPPEQLRLVRGDTTRMLEGARLEADSVIGFHEVEDGRWERIATPAADPDTRLEVLKLQPELVLLGALPALLLVAISAGG